MIFVEDSTTSSACAGAFAIITKVIMPASTEAPARRSWAPPGLEPDSKAARRQGPGSRSARPATGSC
jgi:hypothetical protein